MKLVCISALEEKEKHHGLDEKLTQGQDGSFLSLGNLKERFRLIRRSARFTHHPTTKRPGRLKIVSQELVKTCFFGLKILLNCRNLLD